MTYQEEWAAKQRDVGYALAGVLLVLGTVATYLVGIVLAGFSLFLALVMPYEREPLGTAIIRLACLGMFAGFALLSFAVQSFLLNVDKDLIELRHLREQSTKGTTR